MEMNLSETAFVIRKPALKIRWFTPNSEVNLCGHATLAAAHTIWSNGFEEESLVFDSKSGPLKVSKNKDSYVLDFPVQPAEDRAPRLIQSITNIDPVYCGSNGEDFMAVLPNARDVIDFKPDLDAISGLDERGFIVTAQDDSGQYDYIYRAFFPKLGIEEDPVTGSANTILTPYWGKALGKKALSAFQASKRTGQLGVRIEADRVLISGQAVTVLSGEMHL